MARLIGTRDISPTLTSAQQWISDCLIDDGSMFSMDYRWTSALLDEAFHAFVEHPDFGVDDFMTKLKGQMKDATPTCQQLIAEILWVLLLFPSNIKFTTKRQQVCALWALSEEQLPQTHPLLVQEVLDGIGSGGPGYNTYRPDEMTFLIALARDLKRKDRSARQRILRDYDAFIAWIDLVPQQGQRQFRHMFRYFLFPDRVERISSNNDRQRILDAFSVADMRGTRNWSDRELDVALEELRSRLQTSNPGDALDFYEPPLR